MTEDKPSARKRGVKSAADASADLVWQAVNATPVKVPPNADALDATEDRPPKGDSPDDFRKEAVADMQANRGLRGAYAGKAYELAVGCLCMWGIFLFAHGIIKAVTGVEMWSEKVIIAVTAGVTVNVLAAFLGVIRGLFPASERKK